VSSLRLIRIWQHDVPPLSNFKGAAKRAAAANFEELQIIRELRFVKFLAAAKGAAKQRLSNFKCSYDLTMEWQLHNSRELRFCTWRSGSKLDSCENLTARITPVYQP
jgi:hypothetical protein